MIMTIRGVEGREVETKFVGAIRILLRRCHAGELLVFSQFTITMKGSITFSSLSHLAYDDEAGPGAEEEEEELEACAGATTPTAIVAEVEAPAPPLLFPPALEPEPEESCSRSVARRLRAASIERESK